LSGVSVRTGNPLSLSLAEPVWKQLVGEDLVTSDITEVDKDFLPGKCFSVCWPSECSEQLKVE